MIYISTSDIPHIHYDVDIYSICISYNHQDFHLPKMKVLKLIRLFWGWVFPYISLTYSFYRWVPPFRYPEMFGDISYTFGCFLKWWYPQNTPKGSFLVGKPMVVGYHHFRKPPFVRYLFAHLLYQGLPCRGAPAPPLLPSPPVPCARSARSAPHPVASVGGSQWLSWCELQGNLNWLTLVRFSEYRIVQVGICDFIDSSI